MKLIEINKIEFKGFLSGFFIIYLFIFKGVIYFEQLFI